MPISIRVNETKIPRDRSNDRVKIVLDLSLADAMVLKAIVGSVVGGGGIHHEIYSKLSGAGVFDDCSMLQRGTMTTLTGTKPNVNLTAHNFDYGTAE
jgi:hypothetical protein